MKEFLSHHKIEFEIKDIRDNPAFVQELVDLGSQSTPTLVIEEEVVIGFDPEKLEKLLNL